MQRKAQELHRCALCDVLLGESNYSLLVDNQWVHYVCAFNASVEKIKAQKKEKGSI